jgi:hypothetical protein
VDIIKDLSEKASRVLSLQGLFASLHPVIETLPAAEWTCSNTARRSPIYFDAHQKK